MTMLYENLAGMLVYKEVDGRKRYNCRCDLCGWDGYLPRVQKRCPSCKLPRVLETCSKCKGEGVVLR